MITINVELTSNEFVKLYGESQYVRDFSTDAVDAILTHIEETQIGEEVVDWTGVFMEAGEYTAKEFFNDFKHHLYFDELEEVVVDILDDDIKLYDDYEYVATSEIEDEFMTEEEYNIMSVEDVIASFENDLVSDSRFFEAAYDNIKNNADFKLCQELANNSYLVID